MTEGLAGKGVMGGVMTGRALGIADGQSRTYSMSAPRIVGSYREGAWLCWSTHKPPGFLRHAR